MDSECSCQLGLPAGTMCFSWRSWPARLAVLGWLWSLAHMYLAMVDVLQKQQRQLQDTGVRFGDLGPLVMAIYLVSCSSNLSWGTLYSTPNFVILTRKWKRMEVRH